MVGHIGVGRLAAIYTAEHLDDARVVFMFRSKGQLDYDHRDSLRQKELLRDAFAAMHPQVDRWLDEVDGTPAFYFDAISQLRLDIWSRRRVTLVGDAGYCPGPAVGGSTSLAVLGAYVLAGELARADGDHLRAFAAYELQMREPVYLSRAFARDRRQDPHPQLPDRGVGVDPWAPANLVDARLALQGAGEAEHQGRAHIRLDAGARLQRSRRVTRKE